MSRRATTMLLACAGFAACLGAGCGHASPVSERPRPAWTDKDRVPGDGQSLFVGHAAGASSEQDAVELATAHVFRQLAMSFGVTVESSLEVVQAESNERGFAYAIRDRSRVKGRPIEVRQYELRDRYVRGRGGSWEGWVLVGLPDGERDRIARRLQRGVVLALGCRAGYGCDGSLSDRLGSALARRGLRPAGRQSQDGILNRPDFIRDAARTGQAAWVAWVSVTETRRQRQDGAYYVWLSAACEIIATDSSMVEAAFVLDKIKGGGFSPERASAAAFDRLVERFAEALGSVEL